MNLYYKKALLLGLVLLSGSLSACTTLQASNKENTPVYLEETYPTNTPFPEYATETPNEDPTNTPVPDKSKSSPEHEKNPTSTPVLENPTSTPTPSKPSSTPVPDPPTNTPIPSKPTSTPKPTKAPAPSKPTSAPQRPSPTITPTKPALPSPTVTPIRTDDTLYVRTKSLTLGASKETAEKTFGKPSRIVETEYDFDYLVYNDDYERFLMIAIKNNKVIGFYTDSIDFRYRDMNVESGISTVNKVFDKTYELDEVISHSTTNYKIRIFMDKIETGKVTGVSVLSNDITLEGYTDTVIKNIELLVLDLTNSIRVRNGISPLDWSDLAATSSRKHSLDMAKNNYFDHMNLSGQNPGDRMTLEGIRYTAYGENIIAGYGTAIRSTHGWFNSSGHRDNLLSDKFKYLGVGFHYDETSVYKNYITQNFFK